MTKYEDPPRDEHGGVIAEKIDFPVELDLLRPLAAGWRKLESLTLPEPAVRDIELCWNHPGKIKRVVHLLASLAELSADEVRPEGCGLHARGRDGQRFFVDSLTLRETIPVAAVAFGWSPDELKGLPLGELLEYVRLGSRLVRERLEDPPAGTQPCRGGQEPARRARQPAESQQVQNGLQRQPGARDDAVQQGKEKHGGRIACRI